MLMFDIAFTVIFVYASGEDSESWLKSLTCF